MTTRKLLLAAGVGLLVAAQPSTAKAITLIDHTFDGVANDIGPAFQQISNGQGGGSANLTNGLITTGTGAPSSPDNSNVGFNTSSSINVGALAPAAVGFDITFEVSSVGATVSGLKFNGLFFGVTSGNNANGTTGTCLWTNDPYGFGYVAASGIPGSGTNPGYGDNVIRQDAQGAAANEGNSVTTALGGAVPTDASYADGFTITLSLFDDDTWTVTSTGLSTNLNRSGSLTTTGTGMFDYDMIASGLTLYISLQGQQSSTITVDRIIVTAIPEPGSLALMGIGGLLIARRRREA